MAKTFNSIHDALAYIKSQKKLAIQEIGRESKEILQQKTESNLYGNYSPESYERTGDMLRMIQILRQSSSSVTVGFQNSGGHRSWKEPRPNVFVAPILEEGGHTWERSGGRKSPTNIIKDSRQEIEDKAPEIVIRVLKSKGIKAYRR